MGNSCIIRDCLWTIPKTLSGNNYTLRFKDWYSGWPDTFAVPDRTAETVAQLLLEDITPRYSIPSQIVTDTGSENFNRVMKHTLQKINISHMPTSYCHLQGNSKVQ